MKKEKIILFGEMALREKAREVKIFHKKIHALIDTMKYTLSAAKDGAALAANQIAVLKRITVIDYMDEYIEMVNPEIISFSGEQFDYEGCLSFPGFSGEVKRAKTVVVKYNDRNGNEIQIERSGKMARCIQHEIDHLNGILFVDKMEEKYLFNDENGTKIPVEDVLKISNTLNH